MPLNTTLVPIGANETYLSELMKRIIACEGEAINPVRPVTSVPYFVYQQPEMPYITHRLGETGAEHWAGGFYTTEKTIIGRVVVGHVTAAVEGQNEEWIYILEPLITEMFMLNVYLLSANYKAAQPDGSPDPITYSRDTGTRVFDNKGIEGLPNQIGFEYSISCKYTFERNRRY